MKQLSKIVILTFSLMVFFHYGNTPENQATEQTSKNRIEVIDFHSTHRCGTCNAIESNTLHTLETYFKEEMKSGKITFESVNIDLKKNKEKARKFQASGTSLFLNVIIDGKETIIDLTSFAFTCGRNQKEFSKDLREKLEVELKKL